MALSILSSLRSLPVRLSFCLALQMLAAPGAVASSVAPALQLGADAYTRPGRLIRLPDGRRINLRCMGRGAPTVLLEAGFGAASNAWSRVQPRVAAVTRVCAYDRAGAGFSDPGPAPRNGAAIARDLDRTLRAAGVSGPFIVVGHSAGGLYARLLAGRRLKEVAGLVFVDTSIEYQDRRLASIFGQGAGGVDGIRRQTLGCLEMALAGTASPNAGDTACVREGSAPHDRMVAYRPATWRTQLSEIDTLFTDTSDQVSRTGGLLRNIPTIVLTASPTGVRAGPEDQGAAVWQGLHAELAHGFRHGDQRIVKSGHLMMNERPEVVAGAVLELVAASRRKPAAR